MTADEYKSMHRKLVDYKELDDILRNLKNHRNDCKSGVSVITPNSENQKNYVYCDFKSMGDGFQELVTQKVIEAFDEQISRIEKQMEEL